MIPDIGVFPPFFAFIVVLAIAPVAGIPPKIGHAILAMPWAISSVFESCFDPSPGSLRRKNSASLFLTGLISRQ